MLGQDPLDVARQRLGRVDALPLEHPIERVCAGIHAALGLLPLGLGRALDHAPELVERRLHADLPVAQSLDHLLHPLADGHQVGLLLRVLLDVDRQAAVEVGDLHPVAHVVVAHDVGDVAVDRVERHLAHHLHAHVPADQGVGLLQHELALPAILGLGVEGVVDGLVDLGDECVVVQVVAQEGIGRQDLVGGLQLLKALDEGLARGLVEEVIDDPVDAPRRGRQVDRREERADQVHLAHEIAP